LVKSFTAAKNVDDKPTHARVLHRETSALRTALCQTSSAEQKRRVLEWLRRDFHRQPQWSDHSLVSW